MATMLKKLTNVQLAKALKKLPNWSLNPKQTELSVSYSFSDFVSALSFVAKVTVHAEILNHHPEILLTYGKVKLTLSTKDIGGISSKDTALAVAIEGIVSR